MKRKTTIYRERLADAYHDNFVRNVSRGFFKSSPRMTAINILSEIIRRATLKTDDNVYMVKDTLYVRDIPSLYNLGSDFGLSLVQAVFRGWNCNYWDNVHCMIQLDLNSARIDRVSELVDELCKMEGD